MSVNHFTRLRRRALQFHHRPQYPLPHRIPLQVARLEHRVRPHGGMDRRVLAVLLHEDLGGAVDVEVEAVRASDVKGTQSDFR